MRLDVVNLENNENNSAVELSDNVFVKKYNEPLIHQVITSYMSNARLATKFNKSRADVIGSGRKVRRQKGSGAARASSIKNPIWRGGGVTFAAKDRNYSQKVNKKMYKSAMRSILSKIVATGRLSVVDNIDIPEIKTKLFQEKMNSIGVKNSLVVIDKFNEKISLSSRNLYNYQVCLVENLSVVDLIKYHHLVLTKESIKKIEQKLL